MGRPSAELISGSWINADRVAAWPTTVLINREGTVVFYAAGAEPEKVSQAIRAAGAW